MPPRMVPFPLVLIAVTGAFILVALYADVRGRERRATEEAAPTPVVEVAPERPMPEAPAATSTPEEPAEPELLRLPPEVPTSDVPAVAVYDCWRYEWRDDRLIVDRDYRHLAGDGIEPMVGPETMHLQCPYLEDGVLVSEDGTVTLYWSGRKRRDSQPSSVGDGTIYRIDRTNGVPTSIATVADAGDIPLALLGFDGDATTAFLRSDASLIAAPHAAGTSLYRIDLTTGDVRTYRFAQLWDPLQLTPDRSRAVGLEFPEEGGAPYLHRINIETGQRVRTPQVPALSRSSGPFRNARFIDATRVAAAGSEWPLIIVDIFTGRSAPVREVTGNVFFTALSIDRSTLLLSSEDQGLVAIPVSELPKP